jgi:hypothetical protein
MIQRDLDILQRDGRYPSYGTQRLDGDPPSGRAELTPTERMALESGEKREYDERRRQLLAHRKVKQDELSEYAYVENHVQAALDLIDTDQRKVLTLLLGGERRQSLTDLGLLCDDSTASRHIDLAYLRIDHYLVTRMLAGFLPILSQNSPELFPNCTRRIPPKRRADMVLS